MTIVRIVLADPRSGRVPEGSAVNGQQLIVLADDTGRRAVPLWLRVIDAKLLWGLLERSAGDAVMAGVLEETAARLLHAAGVAVTAVDIEPAGMAGQAGLHLAAGLPDQPPGTLLRDRGGSSLTGPGSSDWTWHEVTSDVPGHAGVIRFGISLAGRGRIELRNPELSPAGPGTQE